MKKLFFVFGCLFPLFTCAQTLKTDVLVIGSNDAAFSAAYQSFKSGVVTTILTQTAQFDLEQIKKSKSSEIQNLYSKFLIKEPQKIQAPKKDKKSKGTVKIDSADFLKVINDSPALEIKRSGSGWEVKLSKDKSVKAKVLLMADQPEKLLAALKIQSLKAAEPASLNYNDDNYRTSIAGIKATSNFLSLYNLLIPNQENLIYVNTAKPEIGQAAGATAAFAAFYETKTSLSNLKSIQGELLKYKLSLISYEDVKLTDSNWLALQKIGVTGIVKGEIKDDKLFFNPEKEVTYAEIKQPVKDYFYKAQIWFDDHQNSPMTLETTISMVCYVGNKAVDATKSELEKKWNKSYKFSSKYDLKKTLTRREFSVIINEYLKPFDLVNVDRTGRVIR